jgi:AraC-like DNA-binding protein
MPRPIPIYQDHDETYRADSCEPLDKAAAAGRLRIEALRHGHYPGRALPASTLPGVKMVGYWDATEDQHWGLDWHRNEGLELTFLERGRLPFAVDGRQYLLEADDMTVTRPWQLHRVGNPQVKASRLHWLIIDMGVRRPHQEWQWPSWLLLSRPDLDELAAFLRQNEQTVWRGTEELRHCWQQIAAAVGDPRHASGISRVGVRLNDLFLLLLDLLRRKRVRMDESLTSSRRTVSLFLQDLQTNPAHLALPWTVGKMAEACGLGVSQFIGHVRRLTTLTPVQFLTRHRLDLAARMLAEQSQASVTDIALQCGFSSGQYFATVFAKKHRESPRAFRRRAAAC